MTDLINHPPHYTQGSMEVIEAIDGLNLGFCAGNVLKYMARHEHKGTPVEDLKKAEWYLRRLREKVEARIAKSLATDAVT